MEISSAEDDPVKKPFTEGSLNALDELVPAKVLARKNGLNVRFSELAGSKRRGLHFMIDCAKSGRRVLDWYATKGDYYGRIGKGKADSLVEAVELACGIEARPPAVPDSLLVIKPAPAPNGPPAVEVVILTPQQSAKLAACDRDTVIVVFDPFDGREYLLARTPPVADRHCTSCGGSPCPGGPIPIP